jgi:hypothetical protein
MGTTQKIFILFEGPAAEGVAKMNFFNMIKYTLNQLEKGNVSYSNDAFKIGAHTFRYDALQTLELADMPVIYHQRTIVTKYILIGGKDGKLFILIPSQGGNDTVMSMSEKTEELMRSLNEVWTKVKQEIIKKEQVQAQKQLEIGAIDKIRKMLTVSTRIKMDMMQRAIGLDADTFSNKIFDWAAEFGFKIDGDFVVIEGGDVTGFISKLDAEFADWGTKDGKKI